MFRGKKCVIVGALEGIGRLLVEQLAARGCNIAFIDKRKEEGNMLADDLKTRFGVDMFFFHGDTDREEDLELFANAAGARFGSISSFICTAGLYTEGLLSGYDTLQDMQTILQNSVSIPYVLHKVLKEYMETGGIEVYAVPGRAFFRQDDAAAYRIVKESVESLTQTCANSYHGRVRVNCICADTLKMMAYPERNGWNIIRF